MSASQDEISLTTTTTTSPINHTNPNPTNILIPVSTIKREPILKKRENDDKLAIKRKHYLEPIQTIQSGRTARDSCSQRMREKAKTTFAHALPEDQLATFHKMTDQRDTQKGFTKGYDRFQSLLSQSRDSMEQVYPTDDANQKYLRLYLLPGHFARECRIKGNQDNRRRDAWNSGTKDGRKTGQKEDSKALVIINGEGVDWTNHSEDKDYALMACNSSDSDTEAYSQGLKKVEAQLVAHQQGQLWYEQKIKFIKIDLDDKTDVLTYHKKLLAEAQKEKEDLKAKNVNLRSGLMLLSLRINETNSEDEFSTVGVKGSLIVRPQQDYPHKALKNKGIVDSGCSRHMTGNKAYLADFQDFNGGPVAFGGSKGYITEGAARASSTNIFSTGSTPAKASSTNLVNTVSTPFSTASPHEGLTLSDPINPEQDDSKIPPLEDIYQNSSDGIFTTSSYDEAALILGDPTSAVQTRSKVNKRSWTHAFEAHEMKVGLMLSRRIAAVISNTESSLHSGLKTKQKADGNFIIKIRMAQKSVKNFDFAMLILASTPILSTQKALIKSCAVLRFQVTPKSSFITHLSAVKRIFRYLKGKPKLGLWYSKVSSFDLESYSDSNYAGANLDRKSTIGGDAFPEHKWVRVLEKSEGNAEFSRDHMISKRISIHQALTLESLMKDMASEIQEERGKVKKQRIEAARLLAEKLQNKKERAITIEERGKKRKKEVVNYEILNRKYPIKEWKTECLRTKPHVDKGENLEEINQNVLVMDKYPDEIPGGFDKVLWGDLMVMFNPDDEDKFWNSQQDWNIVNWKLHGSSGVHTLVTEEGLVIHMLVEKKYPLRKKVLVQMLKLKLESEEDSTMTLELIKFIKKLLAELEPEDFDGDEEDL
ncbi:hypothetical protein Tco_1507250 [Tanacetum coccineum]